MKDLFPGYFKESKEHVKDIWQSCIFMFDTNVLLNLYRYSDKRRDEFLSILKANNDRVWLPNRVAEEYLSNRLNAIDAQENSYNKMIDSIDSLKKDLENSNQHPFISLEMMEEVNKNFDRLKKELTENKKVHSNRVNEDDVRDRILEIFNEKVGSSYTDEKLEEIIGKGEDRYQKKIPPGYKDGHKSSEMSSLEERCKPYGDLIIWFQIIDKAKLEKKPIVLITNDRKEDWWTIFKGKTIGTRPELIKEFKDKADEEFYMYQPNRFLELAIENLDVQVSEELVKETREIRERDDLADEKELELVVKKPSFRKPENYIDGSDILKLHKKISDTKTEIQSLDNILNNYASKNIALEEVYEKVSRQFTNGYLEEDRSEPFQDLIYDLKHNEIEMNSLRDRINKLTEYHKKIEIVLAHKKLIMNNQQF